MGIVDSLDAGVGGNGTVSDDGLLDEVILVGIVLTIYLLGVATDRDGRKI